MSDAPPLGRHDRVRITLPGSRWDNRTGRVARNHPEGWVMVTIDGTEGERAFGRHHLVATSRLTPSARRSMEAPTGAHRCDARCSHS